MGEVEERSLGMFPGFSPILTTFISLAAVTAFWLYWSHASTSLKLRLKGRPSVPPGNLGLPILGETIQYVTGQFKHNGITDFFAKRVKRNGLLFTTHLFGSPTVAIGSPEDIKYLFQIDGKLVQNSWPTSAQLLLGPDSMPTLVGERHKAVSKHLSTFLDHNAVMGYLKKIDSSTRNYFAKEWDGKDELITSKMVDIFTFRLIVEVMMSPQEFETFDMAELNTLIGGWTNGLFHLPYSIPGTPFHKAMKARARIHEVLGGCIAEKRRQLAEGRVPVNEGRDFFTSLLTVPDEGGHMHTDAAIKDSLLLMMFAGADTTSSALTMTILYLGRYPDVYDKLLEEHKMILKKKQERGEGDELTKDDVQEMKFTWRVLQETMRIQSPVSGAFREALTDIEYKGYTIPKGWKLMWFNQHVHYDPRVHENPDEYMPSRFESLKLPYQYIAFGGGQRMCPGMEFAKWSMITFVHHLVKNYRWKVVDPNDDILRLPMPMTKKGVPIKITKNRYL